MIAQVVFPDIKLEKTILVETGHIVGGKTTWFHSGCLVFYIDPLRESAYERARVIWQKQ